MSPDLESLGERIAEHAAYLDAAMRRLLSKLGSDGPRFHDPRGRRVCDVPSTPPPPDLGWEAILARNERLGITPRTNECGWDGCPMDHAEVIDQLVCADQLDRWWPAPAA